MKKNVIEGGTLIDGTGRKPVEDSTLIVEGKYIKAVGKPNETEPPENCRVIEANGKYVMPGIIEGHAHGGSGNRGQHMLRFSLQRGITTVYSVDSNIEGLKLRDGIENGSIRGCARLKSGYIITCTNGHVVFHTADGPWEVRKAVRAMVKADADFVKTAASGGFRGAQAGRSDCDEPNYSLEELKALVSEAHEWGVPVAAHCHTQPGLDRCIEAEVDQIHHGGFIDEKAVCGIKEKDLFYMPTLKVTSKRNIATKFSYHPWEESIMEKSHPIHRNGVRLAHKIGVKLAVGTDYPGHASAWRIGDATMWELMELVDCGLSPMEAIVAATRNTAAAYGDLGEFGTLEPGKKGDILIVKKNPLEDISVLYDENNIQVVMKDGKIESTDEEYKHLYDVRESVPDKRLEVAREWPATGVDARS